VKDTKAEYVEEVEEDEEDLSKDYDMLNKGQT
jgi:hypothetical protein